MENTFNTQSGNIFAHLDIDLEEILENNIDVVFLLKIPELKPAYFSKEPTERILGYPAEYYYRNNIKTLIPEDGEIYDNLLDQCLQKGNSAGEIRFKASDGRTIWVLMKLRILKNSSGIPIAMVGNGSDITKMKNMEQKMVSNARYASLMEMANGMAHEINNPLMIISGSIIQIRHLLENSDNISKFDELNLKTQRAIQRIVDIIEGLKRFSKVPASEQKENCTIRQILEETLKYCLEKYKKASIDFRIKENANLEINVFVRKYQVAYALLQLLNNSFDAVKNSRDKWIEIDIHISHGNIVFSVADSGPAIPNKILSKIMEPFFTTKEIGKGIGLGLSIAKGIAEELNGSLNYDNDSGHTRFNFEIPISH